MRSFARATAFRAENGGTSLPIAEYHVDPPARVMRCSGPSSECMVTGTHGHREVARANSRMTALGSTSSPEDAGKIMTALSHRLCVAPMMDWTDRHCRYFLRLIAPRARLYTEMITSGALAARRRPASPRLRSGRASARAAARRQRSGASSPPARSSASAGATTRSTSTAAARRSACRPAASARA